LDIETSLTRLRALFDSLREERPRPDKLPAWFAASALVSAEGEVSALVGATRERHAAFSDVVGRHSAPSGSLRWIYAALMTQSGVPMERFAQAREALREARGDSKTGSLHAGGSRAALVLCLASEDVTTVDRFYAMKRELLPPWWRSSPSITDTFAAFHAARGDDPRMIKQARDRAVEVFQSNRKTRSHKHEGARQCALLEAEPRTVLRRFEALLEAKKSHKNIRWKVDRSMLMEWAAQGLEPSDMEAIAAIRERLPRSISSTASARLRLAHLLYIQDRDIPDGGQLAAMAAVIAAQTAMIVAATSAATAASASAAT
jgi:hypothetical protein